MQVFSDIGKSITGGVETNPFLVQQVHAGYDQNQVRACWRYLSAKSYKDTLVVPTSLYGRFAALAARVMARETAIMRAKGATMESVTVGNVNFNTWEAPAPETNWAEKNQDFGKERKYILSQISWEASVWGLDPFILKGVLVAYNISKNPENVGFSRQIGRVIGYSGPPLYMETGVAAITGVVHPTQLRHNVIRKAGKHAFARSSTRRKRFMKRKRSFYR